MTNRIGVDVEDGWADDSSVGALNALFDLDPDPVRSLLTGNDLLDGCAHSLVARHNRKSFRIGVVPVADERETERRLLRIILCATGGGDDQAEDFLIEPAPDSTNPDPDSDRPPAAANVWRLSSDSTTVPGGIMPMTEYIPGENLTLIATTPEYEEQFNQLMFRHPEPQSAIALLGFAACFESPLHRYDKTVSSIQPVAP